MQPPVACRPGRLRTAGGEWCRCRAGAGTRESSPKAVGASRRLLTDFCRLCFRSHFGSASFRVWQVLQPENYHPIVFPNMKFNRLKNDP